MSRSYLIGVPPGVGDTYWALTKLASQRKLKGLEHVTICPLQSSKDRSIAWDSMLDFVDACEPRRFQTREAADCGWAHGNSGLDEIWWPNQVVDAGYRLETWLPHLDTDLAFEIKTPETTYRNRVVLYASALDHPWCRSVSDDFWQQVASALAYDFRERPLLIGSHWDERRAASIYGCDNIVGHTTLPQVADILKHAKAIVGLASGMTILGNHFATPTVGLFPSKHSQAFRESWVREGVPHYHLTIDTTSAPEASKIAYRMHCDREGLAA